MSGRRCKVNKSRKALAPPCHTSRRSSLLPSLARRDSGPINSGGAVQASAALLRRWEIGTEAAHHQALADSSAAQVSDTRNAHKCALAQPAFSTHPEPSAGYGCNFCRLGDHADGAAAASEVHDMMISDLLPSKLSLTAESAQSPQSLELPAIFSTMLVQTLDSVALTSSPLRLEVEFRDRNRSGADPCPEQAPHVARPGGDINGSGTRRKDGMHALPRVRSAQVSRLPLTAATVPT